MKKAILILNFILGIFFALSAQVTDLNYLIEYNESTSLYDCKIVVNSGKSTDYLERIQFNTQYTVVVPTGATVKVEELHNPKEGNQFYNGTILCLWEFGPKEIAPPIQPESDFHTIFPNLSPPSAYHNLWPGLTLTLFSLSIDVDPCENAVRLFENNSDPSSSEMPSGGDFSNGFTLGGGLQIYGGNLSSVYYNYIVESDSIFLCPQECVNLEPNLRCTSGSNVYEWSTGETTETIEACPTESTRYYLLVKDAMDNVVDSLSVYVKIAPLVAKIYGPSTICSGETTSLLPHSGGSWSTSYASIPYTATIDNFGNVTGIYEGKVVFTFTASNGICDPVDSDTIYVLGAPEVEFVGENSICIGSTSSVSSLIEGIWESSKPDVASIDTQTGEIIGLAQGVTKLSLTSETTGCKSWDLSLIVYDLPSTYLEFDAICIGSTTQIAPEIGGTWTALNPEIATIEGNIITGVSYGDAAFTFTSSNTGCVSEPRYINIGSDQSTILTGPKKICIGTTTTIEPSTGGTWTSNDGAVATIDNFGNIKGVGAGEVTFVYTSANLVCVSDPSESIIVNDLPMVSIDKTEACIGEILKVTPTGGNWLTDNSNVASVHSSTGTVTARRSGTTTFTYTAYGTTGCSATTEEMTVLPDPFEQYNHEIDLCVGVTTDLFSNLNGNWVSSHPLVTSVDAITGEMKAVYHGLAKITFTDVNTGCVSELYVNVLKLPTVDIIFDKVVCAGEFSKVSSNENGTWYSNDNTVAEISNTGVISALSEGETTFVFTSEDGCISETEVFKVHPKNISEIDVTICEGMEYEGLEESGSYVLFEEDEVTGCDHVIYVQLEVLPLSDPLCTVGLEELLDTEVNVYPNPTKNMVNIESTSAIEAVSIYTIDYSKISEEAFSNGKSQIQLNTDRLNQGLYFLSIKSNGRFIYKKLIIE